jgi:hypothetical protein
MFKKFDFLENEAKILLHETAYDGSLAATSLWQRIHKALDFVDGNCHPDFRIDFLNGLLECVQIEQERSRATNGADNITSSREWAD